LDHEEQLKEQQSQERTAGKKSGLARRSRAAKRHLFVKAAFEQLKPLQQMYPFSADSIDALKEAYDSLLIKAGFDLNFLTGPPFKVGRETLIVI
jgi:hypothetical protein